jgi:2-methylcitrate dehydratase PrpD
MGGLQSAGLQEMLHDNPGIKTLQPGKAAMAGVLAADLARAGAKSPRTLFEGQHGWLKAMCAGEYSEDALTGDLGKRWEILLTYTKLYPTCRHCHARSTSSARRDRPRLHGRGRRIDLVRAPTRPGSSRWGRFSHAGDVRGGDVQHALLARRGAPEEATSRFRTTRPN